MYNRVDRYVYENYNTKQNVPVKTGRHSGNTENGKVEANWVGLTNIS